MNENLVHHFKTAIIAPDSPCLLQPGGLVVTHRELYQNAGRYANALLSLGLKPGDRLAVQCQKSLEAVYLYLGCLMVGGVYLPLNNDYTPVEIAYFLGDAEPHIFVGDPQDESKLSPVCARSGVAHHLTLAADGTGSLADITENMKTDIEFAHRNADDLAAILYTSGTTGRSKGAMLSHGNLTSNARALIDIWQITASDVLLHALPIYHTHGLFVAISTSLLAGGSMIFLPKFDIDEIIAQLPVSSVLMGVPTFYSRLLARGDFDRALVNSMRLFISGSAPLSAAVHQEFHDRTGHAILERYGMTETGMNTSNPYDGERRAGTVGMPLPGVEIKITDAANGKTLPPGETGIIEVRGANVFDGYWRNEEKTRQDLRDDGYFITGDMARFDDDGYMVIVGREKDLIISGGLNIYPAEVETVLDAIDGIAETAIIGLPHDDFGEAVTAIIAVGADFQFDETAVIATAATSLARYKLPKRVIVVNHLPRNTMGKIQKNQLRDDYCELYRIISHPSG